MGIVWSSYTGEGNPRDRVAFLHRGGKHEELCGLPQVVEIRNQCDNNSDMEEIT